MTRCAICRLHETDYGYLGLCRTCYEEGYEQDDVWRPDTITGVPARRMFWDNAFADALAELVEASH